MTTTLTLQLPDFLEQQVLAQAQQHQISPETLALQILTQALTASPGNQPPAIPILSLFHQLHQAYEQGQTTLQVPCNATSLYIAEILYRSNQITDFQLHPTPENTQLQLTLNPHCTPDQILQFLQNEQNPPAQAQQPSSSPLATDDDSLDLQNLNLPLKLQAAFQNVESPNPHDRIQALLTIRELYSEAVEQSG
ncbi:MAG: hypothetical protein AAGG51_17410 [Cyanobacteria bacterium P01_G01_bin.54]